MKALRLGIVLCLCLCLNFCAAQKNELKLKPFIELQTKRSFSDIKTRYWGFNFGMRAKCKFKVGASYSFLREEYTTTDFPIDLVAFPNANSVTKTNAQFFSLLLSPLVVKQKRLNISIPANLGFANIKSEYQDIDSMFQPYHSGKPFFGEVAADLDFRLSRVLKFGVSIGYRHVFTDIPNVDEIFNTPLWGLKIKFGRMCK